MMTLASDGSGRGLQPLAAERTGAFDPKQSVGLRQSSQSIPRFSGGTETRTDETSPLLNHLVRLSQKRRRERQPQCLCRLHVNDQLKLRGLLDR